MIRTGVLLAALIGLHTASAADPLDRAISVTKIQRVSTTATGAQANGDSYEGVFGASGAVVYFTSDASNLVSGDTNGATDVFAKTLATGAIRAASWRSASVPANGGSFNPEISPDGRYLLFSSDASNLVPGDRNNATDVFVKTLSTGAIRRISVTAAGKEGNGPSFDGAFSPDGKSIVFASEAANLVSKDTNNARDIFIKTLATGAIRRISVTRSGSEGNGRSSNPMFSASGTEVLFDSRATNLVSGDTNGVEDVFVKTIATGAVVRASQTAGGGAGDQNSFDATFAPAGRSLVFTSFAGTLSTVDKNLTRDVYLKNLSTGALTLISRSRAGKAGSAESFNGTFSPDGKRVAFTSAAADLITGDTNTVRDIYVRTLGTTTFARVSVTARGVQSNGASNFPLFSRDGKKIVFQSAGSNLVAGDTNERADIFVVTLAP